MPVRPFARCIKHPLGSALAAITFALVASCGDRGGSSSSAVVVSETRTFVDASRPTPPNGSFAGASERTLDTRLWYLDAPPAAAPACGRAGCALLVLAHGFGGSTARFDALGRALAGAGYVVAAPAFPLTNDQAQGGHDTGLADVVHQPGDVSFVIDRLLDANASPSDALGGRIDAERIGAVGHSLGGTTVIALTRVASVADTRVKATVLVAPASFLVSAFFGGGSVASGPPTLVVSGTEDEAVPHAVARSFYDSLAAPKAFLGVVGAHHSDLIENAPDPGAFIAPDERAQIAFFDAFLGDTRAELDQTLADLASEGQEVASED